MFQAKSSTTLAPSFADLTTIGVGGPIAQFVTPHSRAEFIDTVEGADAQGQPLAVIGGGSNLLPADQAFEGLVLRDARQEITIPDEAAPVEHQDQKVHVEATAGTSWDDFVDYCVRMGLSGVEGLSGIPGTVGASVVQNISAYGQEVGTSVDSVEVWDRQEKTVCTLRTEQLAFGYRTSALKLSMYQAPGQPAANFFPTPRFVVLSVTFALTHSLRTQVDSDQLAAALGVDLGTWVTNEEARQAVLAIRASKGMLEDPNRYRTDWMKGCRRNSQVDQALKDLHASLEGAAGSDLSIQATLLLNRHSCGSFFTNPILSVDQAALLPFEAPKFPVPALGRHTRAGQVKTSAAWLIDHAGFHPGFALPASKASLSSVHSLALTNRGGASSQELRELAQTIQTGVQATFGVSLVPEPVVLG